jgi:hypothetical protein
MGGSGPLYPLAETLAAFHKVWSADESANCASRHIPYRILPGNPFLLLYKVLAELILNSSY